MGLFRKLFGGEETPGDGAGGGSSSGIDLHLRLADGDDDLAALSALRDELMAALSTSGAGRVERDEFVEGGWEASLSGSETDRLWDTVAPVLETRPLRKGSYALKRYGGAARRGREERVDLHWDG